MRGKSVYDIPADKKEKKNPSHSASIRPKIFLAKGGIRSLTIRNVVIQSSGCCCAFT